MGLFAERARGIGMTFQAPVGDHEAFSDGLLGGSQQPLVEPHRVRAGHLIQTVSDFRGVESATQHLGR